MQQLRILTCLALLALAALPALALPALPARADWRQFRGTDLDGVAEASSAPKSLGATAWQVELPGRGLSGPIIVGERVFLTASSGADQDKLHVLAFDLHSGERLWERRFWATGRTMSHNKMANATPTPASDGERIFAFYSSNDLACLDLDGNLLWYRGLTYDYPSASNSIGMASSPVVVDDTVICQLESDAEAFAVGIDVETGAERWKIERPRRANWSSLTVLDTGGKTLALLQGSAGVSAVEPRTGVELWSYGDGASTISSSVVADGVIYAPSHGITALKPNPASSSPEILWQEGGLSPSTVSPLVYEGHIYTVNRAGALTCADVTTGKKSWQLRLQGSFSSSPVAAAGRLYLFNEDGLGQVVDVSGRRGEIVAERDLGETILATPAISDGAVFVRSGGHLWKLGG